MASLLPAVNIFRHRNLRYRPYWQVEGKETNFLYYTQRLFFLQISSIGFQQFYFNICSI